MGKISFLLGAATGYVLGARAGKERYAQIKSGAAQLWRSQPVQDQVSSAKHAAKTKAAPAALDAVSGVAAAAGDKMRESAGRITQDPERDVRSETVDDAPRGEKIPSWSDDGGAIFGESQVPNARDL